MPAARRTATQRLLLGADALMICALALATLGTHLINLGRYSDSQDEALHLVQLFLMARGFRPFQEIHASQGPLYLDSQFPLYLAFGQSLEAARLAVALYSVAAVLGLYWLGRQLGGRIAGIVAAVLVAISPSFLFNSRHAMAETPAEALAVLSLACAVRYATTRRPLWLWLAAALLPLGVTIKPMAAAAAPACAVAVFRRDLSALRDYAVFVAVGIAIPALVVVAVGAQGVWSQLGSYQQGLYESRPVQPLQGVKLVGDILSGREPILRLADFVTPPVVALLGDPSWPGLAIALAVVALLAGAPRWPALIWLVASVATVSLYVDLSQKHMTFVVFPLALVFGLVTARALAWAFAPARRAPRAPSSVRYLQALIHGSAALPRPARLAGLGLLVALLMVVVSPLREAPGRIVLLDRIAMGLTEPDRFTQRRQVADTILSGLARDLVPADGFVLSFSPRTVAMAGRPAVPPLADMAANRIEAGNLTMADVERGVADYAPIAVIGPRDANENVPGLETWLPSRYRLVAASGISGDLYVRRDQDQARIAEVLAGIPTAAETRPLAADLDLLGYRYDAGPAFPRGSALVTLLLRTSRTPRGDYSIAARLLDQDGAALGAPSAGRTYLVGRVWNPTSRWEPGQTVAQIVEVPIPADVKPGDYRIGLQLGTGVEELFAPLGSPVVLDRVTVRSATNVAPDQ